MISTVSSDSVPPRTVTCTLIGRRKTFVGTESVDRVSPEGRFGSGGSKNKNTEI